MTEPTVKQLFDSISSRFRPEKAADFSGTYHFQISDDRDYSVTIHEGNCMVTKGLTGDPICEIKTNSKTYVGIELGKTNPQMALMMRKVKVSNLSQMIQFSKYFRKWKPEIPESSRTTENVSRPTIEGPLKGFRILDLTRLLPGPLATMMLADMGAEVIKIEDPDNPDYVRDFPPMLEETSAFYLSLNRNKKSLALNYSVEEGMHLLLGLAKTADVIVEQFRPGVMERMGLGFKTLKAVNPKIVFVSISGYGQTGPYAQRASHDLNYIGLAGLLATTTDEHGKPVIPGGQIADVGGGSYMAVNAVLAALLNVQRTGKGNHVDVSMTDGVLPFTLLQQAATAANKTGFVAHEYDLAGKLANYNVYQTSDERWMALGALEPKFWDRFCEVVNHQEWKTRMLDEGEELKNLKAEVQQLFSTQSCKYWTNIGLMHDICLTPILDLHELPNDPNIRTRNTLRINQKTNALSVATPLKFSGFSETAGWKAPSLGADTRQVLKQFGYSEEQIEKYIHQNIVAVS